MAFWDWSPPEVGHVTLVTGGARSGKSSFAETLITPRGGSVVYVATAEILDDEMAERIDRHRRRRPADWHTIEAPRELATSLSGLSREVDAVLVDCLSIWVSNRLLDLGDDSAPVWWSLVHQLEARLLDEATDLLKEASTAPWDLVLVTNEVGFGVVPPSRLGRAFRDLLGRVNQAAAARAHDAYLVVAGLPVRIKGGDDAGDS